MCWRPGLLMLGYSSWYYFCVVTFVLLVSTVRGAHRLVPRNFDVSPRCHDVHVSLAVGRLSTLLVRASIPHRAGRLPVLPSSSGCRSWFGLLCTGILIESIYVRLLVVSFFLRKEVQEWPTAGAMLVRSIGNFCFPPLFVGFLFL